jgi:hypothetical protein
VSDKDKAICTCRKRGRVTDNFVVERYFFGMKQHLFLWAHTPKGFLARAAKN